MATAVSDPARIGTTASKPSAWEARVFWDRRLDWPAADRCTNPSRSAAESLLFPVSPRSIWHVNGTTPAPSPQCTLSGYGALNVCASADERQPQRRVCRPIRRACAKGTHHRASAMLSGDVRHSQPRGCKRCGQSLGEDFFVPKQLGRGCCLGLSRLPPALMVRRRPRLFAVVLGGCHAVGHSGCYLRPGLSSARTTKRPCCQASASRDHPIRNPVRPAQLHDR